jgi:hypothetical protein
MGHHGFIGNFYDLKDKRKNTIATGPKYKNNRTDLCGIDGHMI